MKNISRLVLTLTLWSLLLIGCQTAGTTSTPSKATTINDSTHEVITE